MKDRIKLIRQNAGMTQQEFAKQIGVSRNTIATYETSVRIPIDAIVLSICREFNINETWLRTGEGNMYM
ncbi:MAG: helix-turn-helix transcriptional regulator, partial [Ruminococcus sp.]